MDKVTLVTLVGPEGQANVALPHGATVADLIPQLAEIYTRRPSSDVDVGEATLARVGGPAFPGSASVEELGVAEGDVLELRGVRTTPARPGGEPHDGPSADRLAWPEAPSEQSPTGSPVLDWPRSVLPRRLALGERIGAALTGAVAPRTVEAEVVRAASESATPRPTALSTSARTPLPARVRRAWQDTDYRRLLDAAIAAPRLRRCATVAVLSPKGGVGKTTITVLLGQLLAMLRSDRVVAVDTNPDFGSLGRSLGPEHAVFVDDILTYLSHPALTITTLDACLARTPHGLMVLPAPTDPVRMAALDQSAYTRVIERLKTLVGTLILDCGTGLWDPATRAAITSADQLVVVSDDTPTTASLVVEACGLLIGAGPPVTVVVNRMRRNSRLRVESVRDHLPGAAAVVVLPEEEAAGARAAAGDFDWDDAPTTWRVRMRELAALLVAGWSELGIAV